MPSGSLLRFPGSRSSVLRYTHDLSSIYGQDWWIDDPDFALANDPEFFDKVERDPVIYQALQLRTLSVAGTDWHLDPPSDGPDDKAAAELLEEIVAEIRHFTQARHLLFRSALLGGRGYAWIKGRRKLTAFGDGKKAYRWWVPYQLKHQDKRSFVFKAHHPEPGSLKVTQNLLFWSIADRDWVELDKHHLRALVRMTYDNRADRLGYGQGIAVPIYLYFRAKGLAWMQLQMAGEMFGRGGIVVAKVDPEREGSTDRTNDDIVDDWLNVIDKMRSQHALVFGKNDEVDVLSPSGEGVNIPMHTLEYADKALYRLITGSLRPGGMDTDTGARAQAEVEQDTTDVITRYDRANLDETLTRHLVKCVWDLNRANLVACGLAKAKMPRFRSNLERKENPAANVEVLTKALAAGIPIRKEDVYRKLDIAQPASGDDVFEGLTAPAGPLAGLDFPGLAGGKNSLDGTMKGVDLGNGNGPLDGSMKGVGAKSDRNGDEDYDGSEPLHFAADPDREDDGKFAPKGTGDRTGRGGSERKPAPGSQLPTKVRSRVKELGVTKLPPAEATDLEVHDLDAEDVHDRAVMSWRDASGKKQHAYTPEFHERNARRKWERVEKVMPRVEKIRETLGETIRSGTVGTPEHEGAVVAAVIADTGLRPGNAQSASKLDHYGVSTMRGEHVTIEGDTATIRYVGKSGKENVATVDDPDTVAALAAYKEAAGDGPMFSAKALGASRSAVPPGVKLKDFRTVQATKSARRALKAPPTAAARLLPQSAGEAGPRRREGCEREGREASQQHPRSGQAELRPPACVAGVGPLERPLGRGGQPPVSDREHGVEEIDMDEDLDDEGELDVESYPLPEFVLDLMGDEEE